MGNYLPCPFCDGVLIHERSNDTAQCDVCGASAGIAVWNTRPRETRFLRFIEDIQQEAEMNMDRAELHKKRAIEDLHTSEEHHQDGRWHGNNDIVDFITRAKKVKVLND